jgi:hypothetical protein
MHYSQYPSCVCVCAGCCVYLVVVVVVVVVGNGDNGVLTGSYRSKDFRIYPCEKDGDRKPVYRMVASRSQIDGEKIADLEGHNFLACTYYRQ